MGAWGSGPFENDSAADWLAEFEEDPAGAVRAALDEFDACESEVVDADVGSMIVAAAEAIATALGRPGRGVDLEIVEALRAGVDGLRGDGEARLRVLAALDRVEGDDSDLAELWAESGDGGEAWKASIEDVRQRLG